MLADVANQLNILQSMLDSGAISPADLNVNVSSDQELADINAWLERLAQNMPLQDGMMLDQSNSNHNNDNNVSPSSAMYAGLPPVTENHLLSASYPITNNQVSMYPNPEQDMYVRSHPIQMYEDASAIYGMTPDMTMAQQQYNPDILMSTTGYREHYVPISDIAQPNYITPDIRTSVNYTSSNKSSIKTAATKYKNPTDSKVDKAEVSETFEPGLVEASEQKKNITTMANVFTSADQDESSNKSTAKDKTNEKRQTPEEKETKQDKGTAAATKPAPNKDVIDVLSRDFASLSVETKTSTPSSNKPLYPSLDNKTPKTTTTTTTTTKIANSTVSSPTSSVQHHRQLLELIGRQINDAFAKRKANVPCSSEPARADAVQVQ